jgi:cytochrome-b5 reductase
MATSTKALTVNGAKVTTVANGADATAAPPVEPTLTAPPAASTLSSPPHAAVYPAGQCVFGEDWTAATLVAKERCKETTVILTFELPDTSKPLGLSTCACILAKFDRDGAAVVRPYTPISTNAMIGRFELLVKIYAQGAMSQYLDGLQMGSAVEFKHIPFNVKIQYPFPAKKVGMLIGGTGIAPMIQALHAVLGTADDTTAVSMLYASKVKEDILAQETLESWAANSDGRFTCNHVLSKEPEESSWIGARGLITRALIEEHIPAPTEDVVIFVCGPPGMYDSLCGPRNEPQELKGILAEMGYTAAQVVKF